MSVVRWVGFVFGIGLVGLMALSIGKTLVVPRGLSSRITAIVSKMTRAVFVAIASRFDGYERKDRILVLWGPATLVGMLFVWLAGFLLGFALILWPLVEQGFAQALRESGSSMLTLGFAATERTGATVVHFVAATTGLAVVALQIAYLPTLYAAFNRRETVVTLLQSRAGSPAWGPEIITRHQTVELTDSLPALYAEWERWAADVAESHSTYPVLFAFRSPHPLRSWLLALLAVMDAAALHASLNPSSAPSEARLCIRMGFMCLREVAAAAEIPYDSDPFPDDPIMLEYEEFEGAVARLREAGWAMERTPEEAWPHFRGWRVNYESVAYDLANLIVAPPGPWSGPRDQLPGLAIVPQRPADRTPDDNRSDDLPRGAGVGY